MIKYFLVCLLSISIFNRSLPQQKNPDLNEILDYYISYYTKENNLNNKKNYLLIGLTNNKSKLKTITIADGCFNCADIISGNDTFIEYKGFKTVIIAKKKKDKNFILKKLSNFSSTEKFPITPLRDGVMYDFARHWEIVINDRGKIVFVCMGKATDKIKNNLFDKHIESCIE